MELSDFYNLHAGETCLLVGNGPNLLLTPPELFDYPSFGMNTCHLYDGDWIPDYYVTVDQRVMREFGDAILDKLSDIPKFIPRPNLNKWQGDNFYRYLHRPGEMNLDALRPDGLTIQGITYRNVMHAAIQVALHMGFTTMLMIGVQHRPHKAQCHFWGTDHGMNSTHYPDWIDGYKYFVDSLPCFSFLNLSEDTCVSADILPRADWREYAN